MLRFLLALLFCVCFGESRATAQIKTTVEDAFVRYGDTQVSRYRVGASITAKRGAVRKVFSTFAVPIACPEQEVQLIEEDISDYVDSRDYRELQNGNARQMLFQVPHLPNKAEAHAILTFEVRTRIILPPEETSELTIPVKPPREFKRYLGKSPLIDTKHSKIRKLLKKIFADLEEKHTTTSDSNGESASAVGEPSPSTEVAQPTSTITDWQRVEAIYDHVQETIEYVVQDDKSALATLRDGNGDCQNISALFIALCRTARVPARIVWVHQHNYPEFCLADAKGNLHWFPCESSGMRAFGEMPLARVIMQKGDNFRVPESRKSLRYASEYMTGVPARPGGGPPSHKFIREVF